MRGISFGLMLATVLVAPSPAWGLNTDIPASGLPTATLFSASVLPDLQGVVSWKTLGLVEPVKQGGQMVPKFDKQILALDAKVVRVQGFVLPLDLGDQQHHFLISAVPPHCQFCLPAGPDAIVEVMAKKAVPYSFEPVILSGKFAVLRNDTDGLLYRLTEAEQVDTPVKR